MIGILAPESLQSAWPDVVELLEARGQEFLARVSLEELFVGILKEEIDLWIATEECDLRMVCFMAWEHHAKESNYHVMWLAGSGLREYPVPGLDKIEQYACMRGAKSVIFGGRKGWLRALEPYGYVPQVSLCKNVTTCWRN